MGDRLQRKKQGAQIRIEVRVGSRSDVLGHKVRECGRSEHDDHEPDAGRPR